MPSNACNDSRTEEAKPRRTRRSANSQVASRRVRSALSRGRIGFQGRPAARHAVQRWYERVRTPVSAGNRSNSAWDVGFSRHQTQRQRPVGNTVDPRA